MATIKTKSEDSPTGLGRAASSKVAAKRAGRKTPPLKQGKKALLEKVRHFNASGEDITHRVVRSKIKGDLVSIFGMLEDAAPFPE